MLCPLTVATCSAWIYMEHLVIFFAASWVYHHVVCNYLMFKLKT